MIDEFEIKLNWLIFRKHNYDVTILISGTSVIIPSVVSIIKFNLCCY